MYPVCHRHCKYKCTRDTRLSRDCDHSIDRCNQQQQIKPTVLMWTKGEGEEGERKKERQGGGEEEEEYIRIIVKKF